MTETPTPHDPGQARALKEALRRIAVGIAVFAAGFALTRFLQPAPAPAPAHGAGGRDHPGKYRSELRVYVIGYGLALLLTAVPFALVYWSALPPFWLLIAIGAFALVQVVVHFRCFLHIDPPKQKNDDLQLILFSSLILLLMIGGTIWILANLAMRMMA